LSIDQWRIAIFRPSGAPFDYLAEVLPQLTPELSLTDRAEFIADCRSKLRSGGDALRNAISALASAIPGKTGSTRILLVADQFEEIFTLTTNRQTRDRYIDALLAACRLDSVVPVHLVLALRADFYAHCLEHAELSRCLEANLYNVPRMTQEQLRETIEKRLALASASAEPGLVDSLLEDVGSEPGNLALLEHALDQLWEKYGGHGRTLTNRAYAEIGRLRGALGRHADEVYASIGDEKQKRLAQKIFLELVHLGEGAQDTRRRVPRVDLLSLGAAEEVEPLLGRLASRRLISTGGEGQQTFVEVSHEALIREWPALREWLLQNRDELRLERRLHQAAEEWQGLDRDPGALLQGARLAQAEEWQTRNEDAPVLVRQFLQASVELRSETVRKEREAQKRELAQQKAAAVLARRSAMRQRWFSAALAVMLLVAVGAAWFAYHQQVIEKSRTLAAQSGELLPRDHGQALDMAIHSWQMAKTEETHLAVAKAFPELLGIVKHDGPVFRAVFSPNGRWILSASNDNTVRLSDADDSRLLAILKGDTGKVQDARFSPDGQRILTASDDHTARVWSIDGRLLATLGSHIDPVQRFDRDPIGRAAFSPDGKRVVTAGLDTAARVWNAADGRLLATLQGHTQMVASASFSPDGKHIVTASWDLTARVWSSADGHLESTLSGHTKILWDAVFFPDSQRIITRSLDGTARIWNGADGHLQAILPHNGLVNDIQLSSNGQRIITASDDHTARIWNSTDGALLFTLQHDGAVNRAEFSPNGQYIVTTSGDPTARVWNAADGRLLAMLEGHADRVFDAAFSPDGHRIVTGSRDRSVRIWNTTSGLLLTTLRGHNSGFAHAEFSHDGQRIVTVGTISQDETARLWSGDGRLLATLQGGTGGFKQAHFSPDGQRIVTASVDHTAEVWNGVDGRLLARLQGHTGTVWQAAFSLDGRRIVTASDDHTARVWNSTDGRLLATLQGHTDKVYHAAFSPDSQRIVTASDDHTARVWNSADGHLLTILQGHTKPVWRASFSPDGRRIVTASFDHTARLWDSTDGRLVATLEGHSDVLTAVAFSPDGENILTASWDHTARVWSSTDGHLRMTLQGHTERVIDAEFSSDGQRIATASEDHTARVWSSPDGRLLAILHGHTGVLWQAGFSLDGQRIVTASLDQTGRVWRVVTLDDIEAILAK
jgi:WD40 repeat protein